MTRYYLYIKAGVQMDEHTRFYRVAIGEGIQGRKVNAWLEAYAFEHGHFFVRNSADATDFLMKCLDSLGFNQQLLIPISGKDLVATLKGGNDDPAFWQACQHRHELMMRIDPHYYVYHELARK